MKKIALVIMLCQSAVAYSQSISLCDGPCAPQPTQVASSVVPVVPQSTATAISAQQVKLSQLPMIRMDHPGTIKYVPGVKFDTTTKGRKFGDECK